MTEKVNTTLKVLREIRDRLDNHDRQLETIGKQLESVDHRLESVDERLGSMDHRLGSMDHRLESVDHRLGSMDHRLESVDHRLESGFESVNERLGSMDRRLALVVEGQTRMTTEIIAVAHAVHGVADLLRERLDDRGRIEDHERRIDALERKVG